MSAPSSNSTSNLNDSPLKGVKCIIFDTFGTLAEWENSIRRMLEEEAAKEGEGGELSNVDWLEFTREWRKGYMTRTREIAHGADGPGNVDDLHLEILNTILSENSAYSSVASAWSSQEKRKELCQLWHRLDMWPDVKPGLDALRKMESGPLLATLSNGSLRLLIDLARNSSLPIDAHFSGDSLQSYKPNKKMYLGACGLLGFDEDARKRGEVAMCASHLFDLRAAREHGLRTIYVRRPTEDVGIPDAGPDVKPKSEGGEVDVVLDGEGEGVRGLRALLE